MPHILPEWLLKTAFLRSDFEMKKIQEFEHLTFYSRINECENDYRELSPGLFNAKWRIRRPYGEDVLSGTLLLLRMGYLEITPQGEIKKTVQAP